VTRTLLAALVLVLAPAPANPLHHSSTTLSNGLRVAIQSAPDSDVAAVRLCYEVGSSDEAPGQREFAHLFEHLMFTGTERGGDFSARVQSMGGFTNATTSQDETCFSTVVPAAGLDTVLWLEADRMETLAAALDEGDLDRERAIVRQELSQRYVDSVAGRTALAVEDALYGHHPYNQQLRERLADLDAATLPALAAFHTERYAPRAARLSLVAPVDPTGLAARLETWFGGIDKASTRRQRPPVPAARAASFKWIKSNEPHARLVIAWPSPALGESDDAALDLLHEVLTGGTRPVLYAGVLGDEIQELQGIDAGQVSQDLGSYYLISVDHTWALPADTVVAAVFEALAEVARGRFDEQPLVDARDAWRFDLTRALDSPLTRASRMQLAWRVYGDSQQAPALAQRQLGVKRSHVAAAVRRWLRPESATIVIASERPRSAPARPVWPPVGAWQ